jgi:XTP/dITP diphosphohydrolase
VIATRNAGKAREIEALLAEEGLCLTVLTLRDFPGVTPPQEGSESFQANARAKALACWRATGKSSLGEDSGLEVDALGGRPGVFSSRFAGPGATRSRLCEKVLRLMAGVPEASRAARFRSLCALALGEDRVEVFEGRCEGRIAAEMRGAGGFGFDPIFIPAGEARTMAELSLEEKNSLSHRSKAVRALARALLAGKGDLG